MLSLGRGLVWGCGMSSVSSLSWVFVYSFFLEYYFYIWRLREFLRSIFELVEGFVSGF